MQVRFLSTAKFFLLIKDFSTFSWTVRIIFRVFCAFFYLILQIFTIFTVFFTFFLEKGGKKTAKKVRYRRDEGRAIGGTKYIEKGLKVVGELVFEHYKRDSVISGSFITKFYCCLLYTSPSPRDRTRSRMPSSA